MTKNRFRLILICLALSGALLGACGPLRALAIMPTPTGPTATATRKPTATSRPTHTKTPKPPTKTPRPTRTPYPTPTITLTPSPVPPLTSHTWKPESILLLLDNSNGDGCCEFMGPPRLILFSDGRLFITQPVYENGEWQGHQLLTKRLTRRGTCQMLNTIDQVGFFDYDPTTFLPPGKYPPIDGAPTFYIQASAWRSNSIALNGLREYIFKFGGEFPWCDNYYCEFGPTILPAVRDTYLFLSSYTPSGLEIFQPTRLGVWVSMKQPGLTGKGWPIQSPSLAELSARNTPEQFSKAYTILEGTKAAAVFEAFNQTIAVGNGGLPFNDGQDTYYVYAEPLLPYTYLENSNMTPAEVSTPPVSELHCEPADGVLPIPEVPPAQ